MFAFCEPTVKVGGLDSRMSALYSILLYQVLTVLEDADEKG